MADARCAPARRPACASPHASAAHRPWDAYRPRVKLPPAAYTPPASPSPPPEPRCAPGDSAGSGRVRVTGRSVAGPAPHRRPGRRPRRQPYWRRSRRARRSGALRTAWAIQNARERDRRQGSCLARTFRCWDDAARARLQKSTRVDAAALARSHMPLGFGSSDPRARASGFSTAREHSRYYRGDEARRRRPSAPFRRLMLAVCVWRGAGADAFASHAQVLGRQRRLRTRAAGCHVSNCSESQRRAGAIRTACCCECA